MKARNKVLLYLFLAFGIFSLVDLLFAASDDFKSLENEYIQANVHTDDARFYVETIEGDPDSSGDEDFSLLNDDSQPQSFVVVSVDGEEYIFGDVSSGNFEQDTITGDTLRAVIRSSKIKSVWSVRGIYVIQEIKLIEGPSSGRDDMMQMIYKISNSGRSKEVGLRIVLDTVLADLPGGTYGVQGSGLISNESSFTGEEMPEYWYLFDDYEEPKIRTQGILERQGVTTPDKIVFANWDRFYDDMWDFDIDAGNDFQSAYSTRYDSAVGLYYNPRELEKGMPVMIIANYGLYDVTSISSEDIRLSLSVPVEPKRPPVTVSAETKNLSDLNLDLMKLEIELPDGFYLGSNESQTISKANVASGGTTEAEWDLQCPSITGSNTVRVTATAISGGFTNTISQSRSFYMDYQTVQQVDEAEEDALVQEFVTRVQEAEAMRTNEATNVAQTNNIPQFTTTTTTVAVVADTQPYQFSELEMELKNEIDELTELIEAVNAQYEILIGIYNNKNYTDIFMGDVSERIEYFEDQLEESVFSLSNQKTELRGE